MGNDLSTPVRIQHHRQELLHSDVTIQPKKMQLEAPSLGSEIRHQVFLPDYSSPEGLAIQKRTVVDISSEYEVIQEESPYHEEPFINNDNLRLLENYVSSYPWFFPLYVHYEAKTYVSFDDCINWAQLAKGPLIYMLQLFEGDHNLNEHKCLEVCLSLLAHLKSWAAEADSTLELISGEDLPEIHLLTKIIIQKLDVAELMLAEKNTIVTLKMKLKDGLLNLFSQKKI